MLKVTFFFPGFVPWKTLDAKDTNHKNQSSNIDHMQVYKTIITTKSNIGFFFTLGIPNGTHSDDEHEPHEQSYSF